MVVVVKAPFRPDVRFAGIFGPGSVTPPTDQVWMATRPEGSARLWHTCRG